MLAKTPNNQFPQAFEEFLATEKSTDEARGTIAPVVWKSLVQQPRPKTAKELLQRYGTILKGVFANQVLTITERLLH